jgi:DNA-binding transcriptional ArsR family regulator
VPTYQSDHPEGRGPGVRSTNGFTALGDPTRRAIFERLARRPRAVGELAGEFPVSRPAVSQHLRVLKEAGLVIDEANGSRRVYRVNPQGVDAMRAYLDSFWRDALMAFRQAAERKGET